MEFGLVKTEEEALGWINATLEDLTIHDPMRKTFEEYKNFFERDFSIKNIGDTTRDSTTKNIRDKLNKKEVMESIVVLCEAIDKFIEYKNKNKIIELEREYISKLYKEITLDVTATSKSIPSSINVSCGKDNDISLYYAIGKRIRLIENEPYSMEDSLKINHTYSYKMVKGTLTHKRRVFKDFIESSSNYNIDDAILKTIKGDTEYLEVVEEITISIDTIKDNIAIIESNTGVVISTNKVILKSEKIESTNNTLVLLTNKVELKDKPFYRVVGENKVVKGKYTYSADNPELCLVYTVNDESTEIYDEEIIRLQYHIYSNKVDADNFATDYIARIKDRGKELEIFRDKEIDLIKRAAILDKRTIAMDMKDREARAKAKKMDAETNILEHKGKLEEELGNRASDIADNISAEDKKKVDKLQKEMDKISKESDVLSLKGISLGMGIGGAAYHGYNAYKKEAAFKGLIKLLF